MSPSPQSAPAVCTHERGAGTTFCIHCRREARLIANERRKRTVLRGTAATLVVATLSAAGALSAKALRRGEAHKADEGGAPLPQTSETLAVKSVPPADTAATRPAPVAPNSSNAAPVIAPPLTTNAAVTAPARVAEATKVAARVAPVIAMGQNSLADGVTATRTDSGVTLAFDGPLTRTRIPEKFERFVRSTLPAVYGPGVDAALAAVPEGGLTKQGDLLTELPTKGIRIPVKDAGTLAVYPETRPGQDGPLVVRYRTAWLPPAK